jgi:hypothetical protein
MCYEYTYDEELSKITYDAILNKIKEISSLKVIVNQIDDAVLPLNKITTNEICELNFFKEYRSYSKILDTHTETEEHINHMIFENREIVAKYFEDLIKNEHSNISLNNFKKIKENEVSHYYRKIN